MFKFLWIVKNVLSMFLGGNHRWVPPRLVHENFRFYSYFIAPQEETSIWIFFELNLIRMSELPTAAKKFI